MNRRVSATGFAVLGMLLAMGISGQGLSAQDVTNWRPFIGCWEPMGVDGNPGLLCFRPQGAAVEMFNIVEGQVNGTERLVADGTPRPVAAEGCDGSESVEFSQDGRRIFTSSSFECQGGELRTGSGIMSFISPAQWIDVRSLTVDGEPVAWIQRYAAATAESLRDHGVEDPVSADRAGVRSGRLLAARDIEIDDVEEAVGKVDAQAVKIWVAALESEFDLDASELVRLADEGVPSDVIDVMVAVSYPDQFAVTPEGVPENVVDRVAQNAYRSGSRFGYRAFLWDPYFSPAFGYRYGYSPFGYYGYGFGGYYGYVPTAVIVSPVENASGGRIVRGQGYQPGSGGGTPSVRPRSNPAPSSVSPSNDRGSSRSSGSGRTAVRRGSN